MWILLAFLSAFLLGCYDINKKISLNSNAVIPVLLTNTLFCTLFIFPIYIAAYSHIEWHTHLYILLKSVLVLSSWIFGYFATKHLPLTVTGLISASRPVMTLIGAMLIYGERLNLYQLIGVMLTIVAIILLSLSSSKHEGLKSGSRKWMIFIFLAAITGCISGLYDKFLLHQFPQTAVQFWYNLYQFIMMIIIFLILWVPQRKTSTPFRWSWNIVFISIFLTAADYAYFYALTKPDAMISIISMIRRSSVVISFIGGVLIFKEKHIWRKIAYLSLIILGMIFLYIGTNEL